LAETESKQQQINTDELRLQYIDGLVSIITPAYNAAVYIAETIASVLAQTYTNWEMLIVNDCSKDNTAEIVQSYAVKDKRIKLINLKQNSGAAIARNAAIQNAKGRYIAFLDSDDLWKKEKLQKQIEFMQQNGYAFTYTNYGHFKGTKENIQNHVQIPTSLNYQQALKGNKIGCLTVMMDRKQIANIHFTTQKHEDYILWLNILKQGITAYGIQESFALYRTGNSKSISGNKIQSALWTWKVYRESQKLSVVKSMYYMWFYVVNGLKKHR
jgi:teichuronic acid biosynthesis glycosyltransferase TuaG